jgi:hypothetical protein
MDLQGLGKTVGEELHNRQWLRPGRQMKRHRPIVRRFREAKREEVGEVSHNRQRAAPPRRHVQGDPPLDRRLPERFRPRVAQPVEDAFGTPGGCQVQGQPPGVRRLMEGLRVSDEQELHNVEGWHRRRVVEWQVAVVVRLPQQLHLGLGGGGGGGGGSGHNGLDHLPRFLL